MKRATLIITIVAITMTAAKAQTASNNQEGENTLKKIAESSEITSKNTSRSLLESVDIDEWVNLILSLIAALGTFFTFYAIKRETKQQEIKRTFQEKIFKDLIRHLYRNKVCICATHWRLQREGFDKFHPSEEHLLKLKVLPEDLRFERFDNTPNYYDILHELELKFRNYNIEIDVALEHLKTQSLSDAIKKRDLVDTLEWKSGYLTQEIIKLMDTLGFGLSKEALRQLLISVSERYEENNSKYEDIASVPARTGRSGYYDDNLEITDYLNKAIAGESLKISLIPFS